MNAAQIIAHKRDGISLTTAEIEFFVEGFTHDRIPSYQMSALAMAIFFRGMDSAETAALTQAMLHSGRVLQWEPGRPLGDKHSTGGIGDKVSLVLAPLVASTGVDVPMISGRGLGPTGGTLDKLEAIPGFRTDLGLPEFQRIARQVGCVISGATSEMAPADKKLYALRDVTGTVPSIPLITASILSKKLAAGLDALVLDVKWGSGAFMKSLEMARRLAASLISVGSQAGIPMTALITDMNQPLGRMVGHTVEVDESIATLQGDGPDDLTELTLALGAELLLLVGHCDTAAEGRWQLEQRLAAGDAYEKFARMVQAQGGVLEAPRARATERVVLAENEGYILAVDTEQLGQLIIDLGGGRRLADDGINHRIGLEVLVRLGETVTPDRPLARLFADTTATSSAVQKLRNAFTIGESSPSPGALIADRLVSTGSHTA